MTLASRVMLASVPLLISLYATRFREEDKLKAFPNKPSDSNLPVDEKFDFIIVGGGTAGCVLARRLADEKFTVLLLEAGGDPPPLQEVPLLSVYTKFHPDINFLYQSTPQKNAALANNGILKTSAGKMLGGSSSHNDMMYERGHPKGYDEWANLTQDSSWKYENMLNFFKKAENYMGTFTNSDQHGRNGPMSVSTPQYAPGKDLWLEGVKELGYTVNDANGPQKIGASPNEFTKDMGRRVSTYTGYIEPIENSTDNLSVRRYSVVEELRFHNDTNIVKGVVYKRHGILRVASATKEVILSAGAYVSPLLLISAGIGPIDELKAKAKKIRKVSPGVGKNLMDHPFLEVGPFNVNDHSKSWNMQQNLSFNDFDTFIDKGDGPMTSSYTVGIAEAFYASKRSQQSPTEGAEWPDLQIYYEYLAEKKNSVVCYIGFNRPYSRGTITWNKTATSIDDSFAPIVEYNSYSVPSDFDATIDGIKFCLKVIEETKPFQKIGAKFTKEPIPQCKDKVFRSDDYWRCYIRNLVDSTYHASGTCKMGLKTDPLAVVDSKLKVIGVERLRVVDASIMPRVTNANTAAPTVGIAEKAAQVIISEYKK